MIWHSSRGCVPGDVVTRASRLEASAAGSSRGVALARARRCSGLGAVRGRSVVAGVLRVELAGVAGGSGGQGRW